MAAAKVIVCPHCYARVMPSGEGICPACRRDTRDTTGTDPQKTALSLPGNVRLPPYCHACGAPTERTIDVKQTLQGDPGNTPALVSNMFLQFL